jgi:hypothetical protein
MKTWKLELEISCADIWLEDGFNLEERRDEIIELLSQMLPYATEKELSIFIEELTLKEDTYSHLKRQYEKR